MNCFKLSEFDFFGLAGSLTKDADGYMNGNGNPRKNQTLHCEWKMLFDLFDYTMVFMADDYGVAFICE